MPFRSFTLALFVLFGTVAHSAEEVAVQLIPLAPPLDDPQAEISGLSWCDDTLWLLPQYPRRFSENEESYFFTLKKAQITDYLDGVSRASLQAERVLVHENNLRQQVPIFDGFEAIACRGNDLWLSIEVVNLGAVYQSYLVHATIQSTSSGAELSIDSGQLWSLDSSSKMRNMGDEAMFVALDGNQIISLHEINDPRFVNHAEAHVLNASTGRQSKLRFPHLPFRITDSTALDQQQRFWVINYKYSGDNFSRSAKDPLAAEYGQGASHQQYDNVERLVEYQLSDDGIARVQRPPVQLLLEGVKGRNWEGLVRLDQRGFLLVTDKHPATLFGFVPLPTAD